MDSQKSYHRSLQSNCDTDTDSYIEREREIFFKNLCEKHKETKKIQLIRLENFKSLINKNLKNYIHEIINIEQLDKYSLENFHEVIMDQDHFEINNLISSFNTDKIKLDPIMIKNLYDPLDVRFYYGEWDSSFKMHGFGIMIFPNGNFYLGTFKNNKMDGLGQLIFANNYENKEKILKDEMTKEFKYKINSLLSKEKFDNDNDTIFSMELFYLNYYRNKKNKKIDYGKNFGDNDYEYYIYVGEFNKNKFQGYGEEYFNKKDYYCGLFECNNITVGEFYFREKVR